MPRVPAGEIEAAVVEQARALIRTPEVVVRTWRAAREEDAEISENDILEALQCLDPVWDELSDRAGAHPAAPLPRWPMLLPCRP
jgi:hypothetical protein